MRSSHVLIEATQGRNNGFIQRFCLDLRSVADAAHILEANYRRAATGGRTPTQRGLGAFLAI